MNTLETERLHMRPVSLDDLDFLAVLWSRPEVMRYMPGGQPRSQEHAQSELNFMVSHWQEHGFGAYALIHKETGKMIGLCMLQYLHVEPGGVTAERLIKEVEIGYEIAPEYWGRGLTKEAARCVLRYGFEELKLPRMVAAIDGENQASRRILLGLGMRELPGPWFYGDCPHFIIERDEYNRRAEELANR